MDDAGGGRRGLRPTITSELAHAVTETWGFSLDSARDLGGSTGLNLRVETVQGPVVVRAHRHHVTPARVEALQDARRDASSAGIPTAGAVLGRGGERHVTVRSSVVEVETYVESDAKMDAVDRITIAIPMLARLHDALAAADLPDAADDLRFANYVPAADVVARTAVGTRRLRTVDPALQGVADVAEQLAESIAESEAEAALPALEPQWCHGDYWDTNVLFGGDDLVLIGDFGFMNRRPRVDDLALTLYFTLWELDAAGHADPAGVLASLAETYDRAASRPLSDVERATLPLAIARQPLWSVAVWAAELDDLDAVRAHLRGHDQALMRAQSIVADL